MIPVTAIKMSQPTIESILQENRLFEPMPEFSQNAHIKSLEVRFV